jgi:hypothetical protein
MAIACGEPSPEPDESDQIESIIVIDEQAHVARPARFVASNGAKEVE